MNTSCKGATANLGPDEVETLELLRRESKPLSGLQPELAGGRLRSGRWLLAGLNASQVEVKAGCLPPQR